MDEIILSDAYQDIKKEIEMLQELVSSLTSDRDDLKYNICPELAARYAREIGDYENRINYQKIMILELKRRIEISRAALNREKTISREEVDRKVNEEYSDFHKKVDEAFRESEKAKEKQEEREEKQKQHEEEWRKRYQGKPKSDNDGSAEQRNEDSQNETDASSDEEEGNYEGTRKKHDKMPDAKDLYRKIVKKLHPDMNPDITEREKDLFNKAVTAYEDGDIATLQEIYDEVFGEGSAETAGKEMSFDELVELRDKLKNRVDALRKEISEIKQAFPYTKKEFLDDQDAVAQKKKELEDIISQNEETIKRLEKILLDIDKEMEELRKKRAA